MSLYFELVQAAQDSPRASAVHSLTGDITYAELLERSNRWAAALADAGVRRGEAVIVYLPSASDVIEVLYGTWAVGAVAVPLDPSRPMAEVRTVAEQAGCTTVVTAADKAARFRSESKFRTVNLITAPGDIAHADGLPEPDWDSSAMLLYTSGTTGRSKCVEWRHSGMLASGRGLVRSSGMGAGERICTPVRPELPVVLNGCVTPALLTRSSIGFSSTIVPSSLLRVLERTRATVMYAAPFIYRSIVQAVSDGDLPAVRVWLYLSAGAPLDQNTARQFETLSGHPIRVYYGSSEAGTATFNDAVNSTTQLQSVGRACEGVVIQILDESGAELGSGHKGEVVISGPQVARGYLGRPDLNAQVFRAGKVHTGDLGTLDDQGYLYLHGRISETVNVAGFMVNPTEVEDVLLSHVKVADALVFGLPDDLSGERLVAHVVAHKGVSERELAQHCAEQLATYKIPGDIRLVASIARTASGKAKRHVRHGG
ncbi:class I adenylate-forming enzyme family protein [Streptomyces asiaticus]|uniref:class I adenylate-forming enzyme family protein n=1 Tax=Streptomyces asiaticus TaxID=114695 RepID=UPI003F667299